MDLSELLRQSEGKTLEFKRNLSSPEKVLRTMVAFANTSGGVILIGVEDGTRRVKGVMDPMAAEERLASLITDSVSPRLIPGIAVVPWRRTHVLVIDVHPSSSRPHYLNKLGPEEGVLIRVGSTNRKADRITREEIRRFARGGAFDEEPMPELNSEAIDFRAASELFAEFRILKRRDLRSLCLTAEHQGREVPTIGGILLFGKDRLSRFPDAFVQAGRFEGTDRRRILDSADIRSLPALAVGEVIAFVQKHTSREAVIGTVRRTERWTVPPLALREAVINAVVHADYAQRGAPIRLSLFDDRLEIENPGLLPFGLTVEEIKKGVSKLRNRVFGRVFRELRLIEQWGSGIQRMTAACRDAGLGEPILEEIGTHFRVTIPLVKKQAPATDATDREIARLLAGGRGLSTSEIAKKIHRSPRATRSRLISMIERGLLVEIASGPQDPRKRYVLASP